MLGTECFFGKPDTEHKTVGTPNPQKRVYQTLRSGCIKPPKLGIPGPYKGVHQTPNAGTPNLPKTGTLDPKIAGYMPAISAQTILCRQKWLSLIKQNLHFYTCLLLVCFLYPEVIFCPDGFEPGHNDICYKFGRQMATFEEARADCQRAPGGDLAVIEDDAEKNYILNKTAGGDWWIGKCEYS